MLLLFFFAVLIHEFWKPNDLMLIKIWIAIWLSVVCTHTLALISCWMLKYNSIWFSIRHRIRCWMNGLICQNQLIGFINLFLRGRWRAVLRMDFFRFSCSSFLIIIFFWFFCDSKWIYLLIFWFVFAFFVCLSIYVLFLSVIGLDVLSPVVFGSGLPRWVPRTLRCACIPR